MKGLAYDVPGMDTEGLLDRVRTATETERSRLGSEKVLLAATDARLEPDAVAGVLAATLDLGTDRLEAWAAEAADDDLAGAMADAASRYGDLSSRTRTAWPDADDDVGLLADLGDPTGDAARAGAGLLGLTLVLDRLLLQVVNFHVNEADDAAADTVRELREGVAEIQADHADQLASLDDRDGVVAGAVGVVESAYDEYAARLEAMGLDPRPIC